MVKVTKDPIVKDTEKEIQTRRVLKKLGRESEEELASILARKHGLVYVDLNMIPLNGEDVRLLPEKVSRELKIAIFQKSGKNVRLALTNPDDSEAMEKIKKLQEENGWKISLYIVSQSSFDRIWNKYKESALLDGLDTLKMSLSGEDLINFEKEFGSLLDLKRRIREIPTTQIINVVMAGAVKMRSSDIHFEPQDETVRMRYRIDGVLQDIANLPHEVYRFILPRIKLMGKMKINIRNIAQDGSFAIKLDVGEIDIRVSIIPGNYGESIVMRLLNQSDVLMGVEELGLQGLAYEKIQEEAARPNGMILTTGPTGSGKTTTLYALINKLNTSDVKIITIEDPIEYKIKGISQTQVSRSKNYTFSQGLRAIVRQDPDIILVGEVRDEETADIAINAALTGHLVLSTLHTNNAAGSIPRLIELGIKPSLIPSAVNAFIAQRLVRKLCDNCKTQYAPALETIEIIKKILAIISPKAKIEIPKDLTKMYKPVGCHKCHNTGYKGRIGIYEVLTIDTDIEKIIAEMGSERDITQIALENGMITMTQDAIIKVLHGDTSMEEVWRVTGQAEFLEEIYENLMEQLLARAVLLTDGELSTTQETINSFGKLNELIRTSKPKEVAKIIFAGGLLLEAGDIHIEPGEKDVKIRYRIDGILQTVGTINLTEYPVLLGEIKNLSGIRTEIREGVKDSRFSITLEKPFANITETKVDVRVSIILGGYGETVVMRLLNRAAVALDIEKLGIRKQNLDKILNEVNKPNGILLNTGPTGSGKSTTLYSLLKVINKPEIKIITVEDPIEYQLPGILQTQVNEEGGYTFSTALRSLLRQNPDTMMIGEIRDEETANIAVQSALTGHLILSTLHTNDSAGAVQRLINMKVRPDDLATSANCFMAQRLVRVLCSCKEKVAPDAKEKEKIERVLKNISSQSGIQIPKIDFIFKPKGCQKCNQIGYKGRTTISEVLVVDKDIEEMIVRGALSSQIKAKAIENGMITMSQDGILKVVEGETTLEEVSRVTEE
jgi:type IV pilus assembly protein PilB